MTSYEIKLNLIKEAIAANRLAHSYVFSASEEIDPSKKITEWILCRQEHTGCGSCSSCLKLKTQNHPDLMEVHPEGASVKNAQIESLQEFLYIRPFESPYKVAVIHMAHLMTEQAQNRLLKVLEEPPEYALIFFVTHNPQGLLETIRSRCQIIDFNADAFMSGFDDDITQKAVDFVLSLAYKDAGRLLEYASYAKEDKVKFIMFLNRVLSILRDLLWLMETGLDTSIVNENKSILGDREPLKRLAFSLSKKRVIDMVLNIDLMQQKIKNNLNFDLTVDQLLFKCID